MAHLIWRKIALNMIDQSFRAYEDDYASTQLNNNTIG
jgi:hypothetical protein